MEPERPERELSSAEAAYIAAFEAYLKAPREKRDQQLVRALCDLALDELLSSGR